MSGVTTWQVLIIVAIILLNVLPWILALTSKRVEGLEKVIWFLSTFFASWLGYFVFYFVVVRNKKSSSSFERERYRDENGRVIR